MSWNQTHHFPQAIIHVDGDAFFASCEQALHPEYKGKPVVVGKDRGIAASMSYEAKAKGVTRAMTLREIKKICPDAIIVSSDYETYSLFSKRMFAIMRRYSSVVEEYGIDEGFMDITGMRRALGMGYRAIAARIKQDIQRELGITVSLGLAPTKVLAKLGSKSCKPDGFQVISNKDAASFAENIPVSEVWGIGPNTAHYMHKMGVQTVGDFVKKDKEYVEQYFTRPHQEIWAELQGVQRYKVQKDEKTSYASISKTRTFSPASSDKNKVYSELIKNIENACIKARRYHLAANKVSILLKTQDFSVQALEINLNRATAFPQEIVSTIKPLFRELYKRGVRYRSTGVVLAGLQEDIAIQGSLFEDPLKLVDMKEVYTAIDSLAKKFGKHTVHTASSLKAHKKQHQGSRSEKPMRKQTKLKGEFGMRRRLRIPLLFNAVR